MNNSKIKMHKKRVIKWENVIVTFYTIITLFKYFIISNENILILLYDLTIDSIIGLSMYIIISAMRKAEN